MVPEPDLLRRDLQRRAGCVAGLLREARERPDAGGGGAPGGHPRLPIGVRANQQPGARDRASERGAAAHAVAQPHDSRLPGRGDESVVVPGEPGQRPDRKRPRRAVLSCDGGAAEHRAAAVPRTGAALGVQLHPAADRSAVREGSAVPRWAADHDHARPGPAGESAGGAGDVDQRVRGVGAGAQRRAGGDGPADVGGPGVRGVEGLLLRPVLRGLRLRVGRQKRQRGLAELAGIDAQTVHLCGRVREPGMGARDGDPGLRGLVPRRRWGVVHAAEPQRQLPGPDQRAERAGQLTEHPRVQDRALRRRGQRRVGVQEVRDDDAGRPELRAFGDAGRCRRT